MCIRDRDIYNEKYTKFSSAVSMMEQNILTAFINEGHYERHLNRMRKLYGEKRTVLLSELGKLGDSIRINGENAGHHLALRLGKGLDEEEMVRLASVSYTHLDVYKRQTFESVKEAHTIEAVFEKKSDGGSSSGGSSYSLSSEAYYVRYHDGDDLVKDGKYGEGERVTVKGDVFDAPLGKALAGWSTEEGGEVEFNSR